MVSLNFEFLLFFNHDDATWDYPKGRVLARRMIILRHTNLERIKGIINVL
jgi:hypothetical protein